MHLAVFILSLQNRVPAPLPPSSPALRHRGRAAACRGPRLHLRKEPDYSPGDRGPALTPGLSCPRRGTAATSERNRTCLGQSHAPAQTERPGCQRGRMRADPGDRESASGHPAHPRRENLDAGTLPARGPASLPLFLLPPPWSSWPLPPAHKSCARSVSGDPTQDGSG